MPEDPQPIKIFLSYSHRDVRHLNELKVFLEAFPEQFEFWDDSRIPTGSNWLAEIKHHLETTHAALLLVSPHFLASRFVKEVELPELLKRRVFCVAVHDSLWKHSRLSSYQWANDPARPIARLNPADRNTAWTTICTMIIDAAEAVRAEAHTPVPVLENTAPAASGALPVSLPSQPATAGEHSTNAAATNSAAADTPAAPPSHTEVREATGPTARQPHVSGLLHAAPTDTSGIQVISHTRAVNLKDEAEMIWIPPGPFEMGDDDQKDNLRHTVTLSGYWIYKDLVTVAQYRKFAEARRNGEMPPAPDFNPEWKNEDHPVVRVTWHDAVAYAEWAGCELPSEAQWEKAARWRESDGKSLHYPWGDKFDRLKLWCSKKEPRDAGGTTPVGIYGVSPCGCTDMAGNVWQWCLDAYDAEFWKSEAGKNADPVNNVTDAGFRVLRGGSSSYGNPVYFRSAVRNYSQPAVRNVYIGFRCIFRAGSE